MQMAWFGQQILKLRIKLVARVRSSLVYYNLNTMQTSTKLTYLFILIKDETR